MNKRKDEWVDKWTNNVWIDGKMNEFMNERIKKYMNE